MIEVDETLRRATDRRSGYAVTYLGMGMPQERVAHFRFEHGPRSVDFEASYHTPGEQEALRASKGRPPSERLQLLRDLKDCVYTVYAGPLELRSAAETETFLAVFKAAVTLFSRGGKVTVRIGSDDAGA